MTINTDLNCVRFFSCLLCRGKIDTPCIRYAMNYKNLLLHQIFFFCFKEKKGRTLLLIEIVFELVPKTFLCAADMVIIILRAW